MSLPALTKLIPLAYAMAYGFGAETGTEYQTAFLKNVHASTSIVRSDAPQIPDAPQTSSAERSAR